MIRWLVLLPLVTLFTPSPAWALKPGKHRSIAETSCKAAGLPTTFCRRMGKAVYEVDFQEWEDLSAHAQTELGQARCTAADAAVTRVERLAHSVVEAAATNDFERAAIELGRALHTIQDECAHHGMTNEQHAFLSLEQTCGDEDVSPDIQPEALTCAAIRTTTMMKLVAPALARARFAGDAMCQDSDGRDTCANAVLPTPGMACDFLALFQAWDGRDTTWNSDVVGSALLDGFAAGLRNDPASSVCGGNATAIDPPARPPTSTASDRTCGLVDLGCLGKVDDGAEVDPYGEEHAPSRGGCSTGHASLTSALALLLLRRRRTDSVRRAPTAQ